MGKVRVYEYKTSSGDTEISIIIDDFDIVLRGDKLIISCNIDGPDTSLSSDCWVPMDEFKKLIAKV